MLYDPNWQKPADVFSLESLIAWLETQPKRKVYDYVNPYRCLLCQYFAASGISNPAVAMNTVRENGKGYAIEFPDILRAVSIGPDEVSAWTFGKALERARAALTSPQCSPEAT